VHLNAKAMKVLVELQKRKDQETRTATSDYVFPSRQGTRTGHIFDLRKPFERACKRAEIENFRIHDIRHTFASIAVMSGASLYDVQKLLGHQDIAMTQRYAHLSDEGLKRATAGVASLLDDAA
jgi:integrase